jgi:antitoxin (DNA-binding transcriptional repressor) of toxin-antitoxin stability system
MQTVSVEEAQAHLGEILQKLQPGEEVVITRDGQPIATIKATAPAPQRKPRQLGTLKGTVLYVAPDFDAIPEGFEEYVE